MTRPTTTGKAQDLITFTRSTTGTYLGSDGLLKSAAIDEARIEYDASGNCLGLLVEEARTNLLPQSIANANWGKIGVSITENFATAPDESSTAYKISETTANSIHYAQQTNIQFTSGITYTESLIAKAGTNSVVQLLGTSGIFGSLAWANFDLSDGTIGSKGAEANAAIKPLGNGWYRCSLTMTATVNGSASAGFIILAPNKTYPRAPSYQGNSDNHIYAWGIQTEAGSFPTSYIPTSGSAVTRAADVASLAVSEFGYNQDQGTIVAQATSFYLGQNRETVISTADSSSNLGVYVGKTAGGGDIDALYAGEGGSNTYFSLGVITEDTSYKFAFAIKTDDFAGSKDGGAVVTDTSGTQRTNITDLGIGSRKNAGNRLNGHIKSIQYYPLRLSNAQLQALTI